jgi:hypothetical protein
MPSQRDAAELPVLVMYNLDAGWEREEKNIQKAEIELMSSSLEELGHPVSRLEINGDTLHRTLPATGQRLDRDEPLRERYPACRTARPPSPTRSKSGT